MSLDIVEDLLYLSMFVVEFKGEYRSYKKTFKL